MCIRDSLYSATYVARPIAMEEGKPVYAPKVKGNPNEPDEYVKIYSLSLIHI